MEGDKEYQYEISCVDLNKKRKLQEEQLGFPLSKHRFRDRSCRLPDGSPITDEEEEADNGDDSTFERCESIWDSNSFIGEYDTGMSIDDTQAKRKYEMGQMKAHSYHQSATSSGSCSINNFNNTINCPISFTPTNSGEDMMNSGEDPNRANLVASISEDHLAGFDVTYAEYCKDQENVVDEQPLDMAFNETMIFSNNVETNLYVLSSDRWSINQDAPLGARKPTIDQEFEQYFSTLML